MLVKTKVIISDCHEIDWSVKGERSVGKQVDMILKDLCSDQLRSGTPHEVTLEFSEQDIRPLYDMYGAPQDHEKSKTKRAD